MTAGEALKQLADAFAEGNPRVYLVDKPSRRASPVEYAAWRLAHAWRQSRRTGDGLSADHAVLLRQVTRWAGGITLPTIPPMLAELADKAGLRSIGNGRIEAEPFVPQWLVEDGDVIDSAVGIDAPPISRRRDEWIPAEYYLRGLQYDRWQSPAQKEAAWLAMTAPKRSTALIVLPTGTGKSLCFQAVARASGGLTVVIVPTVALAIDQWRAAVEVLPALGPQYFAADDRTHSPERVLAELKSGTCRMLFTSPEACVSGRLRDCLGKAAANGLLTNLVIDEAHLVETWGTHFRVDFQFLSSLRRNWLQSKAAEFRTILLSATVSPASRRLLRQLYADEDTTVGNEWLEFSSQRVRPEMKYFFRCFDGHDADARRRNAIFDCAWHLPRPAIYYTTEVDAAVNLCDALRENGFQRVEVFTGDTPAAERRTLLERWRQKDEIDLMVATSAFGLGVDKPDVRAVVHACLPENLNRYYQEVGRGGRDGASSVCVLLPSAHDFDVATGLLPTMLKPDTLQDRWEAMWSERRPVEPEQEHIWKITPRTQRMALRGERSGKRNAAWNKRLLLQLLRAKKIELIDVEYDEGSDEEEGAEWITIRILDFMPESKTLGQSIASQRDQELEEARVGLGQMREYLKGETCIKKILRRTYGYETVAVCGGCRHCRRNGRDPDLCPPLAVDTDLGLGQARPPVLEVVGNCPDPLGHAQVEFREVLRQCMRIKNTRRFVVDGPVNGDLVATVLELAGQSAQAAADVYRVDTLRSEVPFLVRPDENVAVFHIGRTSQRGLELDRGRRVSHLFCGPFYVEPTGRHYLVSKNARLFTDWRQWIRTGDD
ncbi:MAG: protein DpdF [Bacillota bacterium]